jgi:16S rRNA (cytidine1402-2'-O)-methyltransferase
VLLNHYQIQCPVTPYHQHNEHKIVPHLIDQLKAGKTMALITDAGTPGISDPAFLLVRACIEEDISVTCLPGATAFVPALVSSGLPSDQFTFIGFLPLKKGRQTTLKKLAFETRTMILYESPMRLVKTLSHLMEFLGPERRASVSRELSKKFEETKRGSLHELHAYFSEKPVKGEIVLVLQGNTDKHKLTQPNLSAINEEDDA